MLCKQWGRWSQEQGACCSYLCCWLACTAVISFVKGQLDKWQPDNGSEPGSGCRESEMRKAHDSYMSGVERDAKQREAERRAEADRLRRNEVQPNLSWATENLAHDPCFG